MNNILSSPIIRTLLGLLFVAIISLGLPYLVPLPGSAVRPFSAGSQIDTKARYLTESVDYKVALERPLFHVNRKKPVKEIVLPKEEVKRRLEAPFKLVGILGSSDTRSAYLENTETGETLAVRVHDMAGIWKVDTIGQDFVALVVGDERRVIQLAGGG